MKCPHCEKEIPGSPCPGCGEIVFEDANYCSACGTSLKESASPVPQGKNFFSHDNDDGEDIDFDNRVLCPDGTCTGIIVDGRCTECGKVVDAKEETDQAEVKEVNGEGGTDESAGEKDA